ncbi:hypothetical protein P9112_000335 [Eukaryota sp. TZLM1-RC]
MTVEFQAVLFCWPEGEVDKLTQNLPIALLRLGNVPLIDYHLALLERFGITDLIIICPPSDFEAIAVHLSDRESMKISLQSSDPHEGTVVVLKRLIDKHFITRDVFVSSICSVMSSLFHDMVDLFRIRDACCVFLASKPDKIPSIASSFALFTEQVCSNKVVGIMDGEELDVDLDDASELTMSFGLLQRFPRISIRTDLCPSQVFLFSFPCLNQILQQESNGSLWHDILPKLILNSLTDSRNPGVYAHVQEGLTVHLTSPKDVLSLSSKVVTGGLRQVVTPISVDPEVTGTIKNSLFSGPISGGVDSTIINSSIGLGVELGAHVQVKNSTVLDGVVVGDQTNITSSFIAGNTSIGKNVQIKNSIICTALTIADNVTITDAVYESPSVSFDDVVFFE